MYQFVHIPLLCIYGLVLLESENNAGRAAKIFTTSIEKEPGYFVEKFCQILSLTAALDNSSVNQ